MSATLPVRADTRPSACLKSNFTPKLLQLDQLSNGRKWLSIDSTPYAFENAASAGAAIVLKPWEASIRLRYLGPYPLLEDNSVRDHGSTVVNARAAWKGGHIQIYGEVINIFDSRDKDIAYYYESYIPSYDIGRPLEGRLSRVVEPRTVKVGAKFTF